MSDYQILEGHATPIGTSAFASNAVLAGVSQLNFRMFQGLNLSSLGMGTYLGDLTHTDDALIESGVVQSIKSGAMNVIDTALNYRAMKSEKSIGRALLRLADAGVDRKGIFISTKNGYITNDGDYPGVDLAEYIQRMFIENGIIEPGDISSGYNVMNPNYISRCIDKSLSNLHLSTIDLVYIHNAYESWHQDVDSKTFFEMLAKVFEIYETYRKAGRIQFYGMATWTCFRAKQGAKDHLSLQQVVKIAESIGGSNHGFRFIQMPYNLLYFEANSIRNQSLDGSGILYTPLEAASRLNIGVFASVPLMQGRLLGGEYPDYPGAPTGSKVGKIIQVIRSSPGIVSALIGQKRTEHLEENTRLAKIPILNSDQLQEAMSRLRIHLN